VKDSIHNQPEAKSIDSSNLANKEVKEKFRKLLADFKSLPDSTNYVPPEVPGTVELPSEVYKISSLDQLVEEVEKLKAENKKLRQLLWQEHPCEGKYGDDGELQCNSYICVIDFKRNSVKTLEDSLFKRSLIKYKEYTDANTN